MKTISALSLISGMIILTTACGKADKPKGNEVYKEELSSDGSNISGNYSAVLYPVNINLHAPRAGMAVFNRTNDELTVKVKLEVGAQGASYRQAVYWGNRCPTIDDDRNKDGYLDMPEIEAALGDVIVPLDGDLDGQSIGSGKYPSGMNQRGSYFYKKTASFTRFFEDLRGVDPNPNDRVRKLEDQDGFTFLNKIVLIQGATEAFKIPTTVSTYYGLSRIKSLPIACGVIYKSNDVLEDELETPIEDGFEPEDRPVVISPNPAPVPPTVPDTGTTAPTPTPEPSEDGDGDEDGGVVDSIRSWWNRVTGNDDDND